MARRALAVGQVVQRRIEDVPAELRDVPAIGRIDYQDAFEVGRGDDAGDPLMWARSVLDGPPRAERLRLLAAWAALGLAIRPWGRENVLGWRVDRRSEDRVVLAAQSWLGMSAELAFVHLDGGWWFASFLRLDTAVARKVWAPVVRPHQRTVLQLLRDAEARAATLPPQG